jgi:CubicO group peptidase (beta-lactamase class C family)
MFRRHIHLLGCAAILVLVPAAHGQSIEAAAVDTIVQDAMKAWQVPGAAVIIVKGNQVLYAKGHGVREIGSDQPVTPDTLFAIASTTKAFTTTAIAMLADDGKLSWDDPVRKHVDFFRLADPLADRDVTLRDLVTHRTGLSRHDLLWLGSPWGREEIIRRIGSVPLTKPFRSAYQYQNIMYLTAGYAAGKANGSTWEELVQKRIFDPLGMAGANFSTKDAVKAADHATPHGKSAAGKIEAIAWRNIDNIGPAGSINAGVRDLGRWLRFQLGDGTSEGKRLLSERRLAELHSAQVVVPLDGTSEVQSFTREMNPETSMMNYGLGWAIQDYRGHLVVSHGGSIDGFRSQVVLLPKAKIGVAILSNLGRTQFPEAVRNGLLDLAIDAPRKDWNEYLLGVARKAEAAQAGQARKREAERHKDTKPSRDLAAYAGNYENSAYGTVAVSLEDGALVAQWSSFKVKLEHYHFDTFSARGDRLLDKQLLTFTLDAEATPSRLTFLDQLFSRVKINAAPKN